MRCRACNIEFDVYKRCITLEDGNQVIIDEDLCKVCLAKLYREEEDDYEIGIKEG